MPTVRLNNGNIEADGSLNALSVTTREMQTDSLNVTGQLIASGDITAARIDGDVNVTGTINTSEVYADAISTTAINGLVTVQGDVHATSINASAITGLTTVQGDLNISGDLSADNIQVVGVISSVNSLQADSADIGRDLIVTGSVRTSNLSVIGTLAVDSVNCGTLRGNLEVNGQADMETLVVGSAVIALSMDCKTAHIDDVNTSSIEALSVNVEDTLNVSGDLIVEGDDDRVLGEPILENISDEVEMRHNTWYNTGAISTIRVLADTDSGRVKTCYIIAHPVSPLVLNGVQWLWAPVDLEDTSKTHVIALQQIGTGIVMANLAYSFPA